MDNEFARLCLLRELELLDTPPEPEYDDLVALAARVCGTPCAVLTLVDEHRQWFKARLGVDLSETAREHSFCARAIESDRLMVVEDATRDPRFSANPFVTGGPRVRFYAGKPLVLAGGERIGALAVFGDQPRRLDDDAAAALAAVARLAVRVIELRRERKQHADTALRLRDAQAIGKMGAWELDIASRGLQWSEQVFRIFGIEPPVSAWGFDDFLRQVHPDDRAAFLAQQARAEAGEAALDIGHRIIRPDGATRHLHERAELAPALGRRPARLIGTVRDVTDEVQARQALEARGDALARASARLRRASRLGHLGAWELDAVTGELWWDDEIARIFGLAPRQPVPLDEAIALFTPEAQPLIRQAMEDCRRDGKPYDLVLRARRASGEELWTRATAEAARDASGRVAAVHGAFQDITEQVRATEAMHRIDGQLKDTLERMNDAFYLLDRAWRVLYFNAEAERLLGRPRAEVLGQVVWEVFPATADSQLQRMYEQALAGGRKRQLEYFYAPQRRWYAVSAHPSEDGLAVYFQDVTQQRSLAEQLQQMHKLESLGQLTGGVAHDFNNLLTVIIGNAELLCAELPPGAPAERLVRTIGAAGERGAEMTQRLLAFARRQALEPRAVDFNRLLLGVHDLLRRTLGEHIEVRLVHAQGLWPALVDPGQLENAVLNLAINARDAMPRGGVITIETANQTLDAAYAAQQAEVRAGEYVMLAVADNGSGIPAEILGRVFEPFFTTKAKGKGTGLGLAMVYGFVKQSGGHVTLYSEPGRGTTVRLYLPRSDAGGVADAPPLAEPVLQGRGECVLLVEDDPSVRELARALLDHLGYRVLEADSGPAALERLRRHAEVELLFTDVVMPGGMGGRDLADAAQRLRPGLPVLFSSGYSEEAFVHHGRLDPGVLLLSKPYRRADLARKLRQTLEGARGPGAKP